MESLKKQAAKLLGEQKKYRRWLAVFLCMAIAVTAGTTAALKMNGQALSHKQKVLDCGLEVHEHTAECYESGAMPVEGAEGAAPVCGFADYVVHVHNDDCYGGDGELVCQLEQAEPHIHDESCYTEQLVLMCGLEENPGHQHTEECRALICGEEESETVQSHQHTEECRALVCGMEETEGHQHTDSCRSIQDELICESAEEGHEHTENCYQQVETITCGMEEAEGHTHTEACYDAHACGLEETTEGHVHTESCYDPYACGTEEGAEGHAHTDECYLAEQILTCGKLELHTHVTEGEGSCYDAEGSLICGIPELKEHVHGEDCFVTEELTKEEVEAMQGGEGTAEDAGDSKVERTIYQKSFENEFIKIIAEYDETAGIPVEAELFVEQVSGTAKETDIDGVTDTAVTTESVPEGGETEPGTAGNEAGTEPETGDPADTDAGNGSGAEAGARDVPEAEPEVETDAGETPEETEEGTLQPTSEDVTVPGADTGEDTQPVTESGADAAQAEGNDAAQTEGNDGAIDAGQSDDGAEVPSENEEDTAEPSADAEETEGLVLQGKGRIEIVPEEVTYRIGFRLNGEEIEPQGSVTFTVWNLEEEESEPQTIACSGGSGDRTVTLARMVEVFVRTEFQKEYEDGSIRVIAEYNKSANIPEEAELRVSEITLESDPERFADCEEKFREAVEDENAEMSTLLEIGFYVDGKEIEPEDTVTMMVQFFDGEGQPIGDPINVVHFAEDRTEVLENSKTDEEGYVTFKTESFSPFAFYIVEGAALGVGPGKAIASEIPLYTLSEEGVWQQVGVCNRDEYYIQDVNGQTYILASGIYDANVFEGYGTSYNLLLQKINNNESTGEDEKWIAYSIIENGEERITTAKFKQTVFGFTWVCEAISGKEQIAGIYYLHNNKLEYNGVTKEKFEGKKYTAILNPGNGNGGAYLHQYGNIDRIEIEVTDVVESDNVDGTKKVTGIVTLPSDNGLSNGQKPIGYDFRLVGWYNIADQVYYNVENGPVEAEVDVSKKNIFYADWVAASYNFHDGNKTVKDTESTNDFIKTRIFDFNELFNIYSTDFTIQKDQRGEYEVWKLRDGFYKGEWSPYGNGKQLTFESKKKGNPFILIAGGRTAPEGKEEHKKTLSMPEGEGTSFGNHSEEKKLAAGQWGEVLQDIHGMLFAEGNDVLGVHYVGEGDHLYYYNTQTGKYEYDSSLHAASYQENEGRFYVYETPQLTLYSGSSKEPATAFLPFNGSGNYTVDASGVNYHFGMCSEINFYLPNTESTSSKEDLIFEFSGDDDVWVFLDGELILDMGGIHKRLCGEINFSKQTWKTYQPDPKEDEDGNKYYLPTENNPADGKFSIKATPYNEHKLTIYYMERGAGESNCKISFNIKPRYLYEEAKVETVKVDKVWEGIDKEEAPEVTMELYKEYYENGTKKEDTIETVTLNSENDWSYTWEGLEALQQGSDDRYKVREVGLSGYDVSTFYGTIGSWDYWVQSPLEAEEILILNVGEESQDNSNNTTKYALGHDLQPVSVTVQNGTISPLSIKDEENNIKWRAEEVPSVKEDEGDKQYKLSFTDKDGTVRYLAYNEAETALQLVTDKSGAVCFKWDSTFGHGLQDSQGNGRRIVYKEGKFVVDECYANVTDKQEDKVHVYIYMLKNVSSRVNSYTVTNTYQPTITIKKVDRDNPKQKLPGARFTLTCNYTVTGGDKENPVETIVNEYYDGASKTWREYSPGKDTVPDFEMETGELQLKETHNGDYVLTEIGSPGNYKTLPNNVISFKVKTDKDSSQITDVVCGYFRGNDSQETEEKIAELEAVSGKNLILLVKNEKMLLTTKVKFTKNSTASNNPALGGAKFELYRELTDKEIEEAGKDDAFTELEVDGNAKKVIMVTEGMHENSDENTGVFFEGDLQEGTYYLKEIAPPAGYNILTDIVTITVTLNENTSSFTVTKKIGGNSVIAETEGEYKVVKILNTQGYELPETGSLGTKPFTIGGAMLITATAILMYGYSVRRRKSERRLKK